jgi:hypothetical protein
MMPSAKTKSPLSLNRISGLRISLGVTLASQTPPPTRFARDGGDHDEPGWSRHYNSEQTQALSKQICAVIYNNGVDGQLQTVRNYFW